MAVTRKSKANPHPLPLKRSGLSSDVESAQQGGTSASSSSAALQRREVAYAWGRIFGVHCKLRVARDKAAQLNAAVDGAVPIAQEEAAQWEHGNAGARLGRGSHLNRRRPGQPQKAPFSAKKAISAAVTAAAWREAVAAPERRGAEAAAREAAAAGKDCAVQEAIAEKDAEVRALEETLAKKKAW